MVLVAPATCLWRLPTEEDHPWRLFSKDGQKYDLILDITADKSFSRCVDALNPSGRDLIGNPHISDMFRSLITTKFTDKTVSFAIAREKKDELVALTSMVEDGKTYPVVDSTFPMEQASEAHCIVEAEQRLGAIAISIA